VTTVDVTRRALLRGLAVVAVGGVGGFLVARNSAAANGTRSAAAANGYGYTPPKHPTASTRRRLAALSRVPVGGGLILGDLKVVLTRDNAGTVHGFSAVCTHQGCTVGSVRGGVIACPCHGSKFDAATGAVVHGPAPAPLPPVAVVVTAGVVYAD
jgi:Rieske Fe-S protein